MPPPVEKPDSSETVQVPTPESAETKPKPGLVESDSSSTETQNRPEPSTSTSAADEEESLSPINRVQDSEVYSGSDPETKGRSPAVGEREEVQLRPQDPGENVDLNKVSGNKETGTSEHNDPDSGPNRSPKKSRNGSPGKIWKGVDFFPVKYI